MPSKRRSARSREAVEREIRRRIVAGELRPGARVPQDDVAAALGVSRIPVREALISLEREGWVTTRPHRGSYVNGLDEKVVRDHYALCGELLGFAARRALDHLSAEDVTDLASFAAELRSTDDLGRVDELNDRYLRHLIRAAGSDHLVMTLRAVSELVPGNFFAVIPGAIGAQQRGIAALQEAIERGDGEAATKACVEMEREQAENVLAVLAPAHGPATEPSP
jgi:DNA-binding GntR family transcriptional regulator